MGCLLPVATLSYLPIPPGSVLINSLGSPIRRVFRQYPLNSACPPPAKAAWHFRNHRRRNTIRIAETGSVGLGLKMG
jgi:hypothetical protein